MRSPSKMGGGLPFKAPVAAGAGAAIATGAGADAIKAGAGTTAAAVRIAIAWLITDRMYPCSGVPARVSMWRGV